MTILRTVFLAALVSFAAACDDRESNSKPDGQKTSTTTTSSNTTDTPDESSGEEPASGESETTTDSSKSAGTSDASTDGADREAIARTVCPSGALATDANGSDFACTRCPDWAQRDEVGTASGKYANLTIHTGHFTPRAATSGRAQAVVNVLGCAAQPYGSTHVALLDKRSGKWSVTRHSAKLDVGSCEPLRIAPPERTSLQCKVGGRTRQGVTSGKVVTLFVDSDGWKRQPLAELKMNRASGMGDHCLEVRPEVDSTDGSEPENSRVDVRIRGRKRERTDDDKFCQRMDEDDWDDDTVVRYRWNGSRFDVPDRKERTVLERNVALARPDDVDLDDYLTPKSIEERWSSLDNDDDVGSDAPGSATSALEAYDPSNLPDTLKLDPENILDEGLRWSDDSGENLLVMVKRGYENSDGVTKTLYLFHYRETDGRRWKTVRDFRQTVRDCNQDLVLRPELGPWSLTDLDGDGLSEVTFAWSNGCVGVMEPATHKVLVTEDGDKSILRGRTRVPTPSEDGPTEMVGGEIREKEGFDGDPRRLEHAKRAWNQTAPVGVPDSD